ncbi:hypothetical protein EYZ11_008932 [Aspergillus tanneri]|uniref:Uncharacterized protein n=1 Tax=Aspergillus tanneri TaxID=1220188 RepID=A0A4S3J9C2_9EURO|nr:hypothetical protein EYZ11_008932 [Aspergillus tanneri]
MQISPLPHPQEALTAATASTPSLANVDERGVSDLQPEPLLGAPSMSTPEDAQVHVARRQATELRELNRSAIITTNGFSSSADCDSPSSLSNTLLDVEMLKDSIPLFEEYTTGAQDKWLRLSNPSHLDPTEFSFGSSVDILSEPKFTSECSNQRSYTEDVWFQELSNLSTSLYQHSRSFDSKQRHQNQLNSDSVPGAGSAEQDSVLPIDRVLALTQAMMQQAMDLTVGVRQ